MAANGVIPTLFINQPVIEKDSEIAAYLLKFTFWNPGWTSSQIENMLCSMRKIRASTNEDISKFPHTLQSILTDAVRRFNPAWKVVVTTELTAVNVYKLIISMQDGQGTPLILSKDIVIKDNEFMLATELEATDE